MKDDDDDDDDEDDGDIAGDEPEGKQEDTPDEKYPNNEEKIKNLVKNSKPGEFYQKECFKKCILFNKSEEEWEKDFVKLTVLSIINLKEIWLS